MGTNTIIQTRRLGKTGFDVSEIGFGAWAIGGSWGEDVDESVALAALNAAIDTGVNFIDTADVYGGGRSETLIGKLLRSRSERIYVATKMGRFDGWAPAYDAMEVAVAASARRLGVDVIDLMQLHCIPPATLQGPVFEHLERLKSNGLIRHYGASVESIDEAITCMANPGCATLQVIFNIFRQRLIEALFPAAQSANVGIIARVPLVSGVLSGKYKAGHQFAADDHRQFNANGEMFNVGETFAGVPFDDAVRLAQRVHGVVGDDLPLAVNSLRWILDHPAVSTVIPGAKNPEQARANASAAAIPPLSAATHAALAKLYAQEIDPLVRGPY